jgi:hypothetical protein
MKGGTISKQVSPQGTIQRKAIESYASGKEVSEAEKRALKKALEQHDVSENNIKFEDFLKNLEGHISPLHKEISHKHSEYGLEGIDRFRSSDVLNQYELNKSDELIRDVKHQIEQFKKSNNVQDFHKANDLENRVLPFHINSRIELEKKIKAGESNIVDLNDDEGSKISKNYTILFSNPKQLGEGTGIADSGAKHFPLSHQINSTLGHSRFFAEDDEILHALESQSDYYQGKRFKSYIQKRKQLEEDLKVLNSGEEVDPIEFPELAKARNTLINDTKKALEGYNYEKEALGKYHIERLLQENMAHAHGEGYKKLRYPTSETAAKIQQYPFKTLRDEFNTLTKKKQSLIDNPDSKRYLEDDGVTYYFNESAEDINKRIAELEKLDLDTKIYTPERQTILNKYDEFPSMSKKVLGFEPIKVTDKQGHSWYEMGVPEEFDIRAFKKGGRYLYIDKKGDGAKRLGKAIKPHVKKVYNTVKPYLTQAYNKGREVLQKVQSFFPSFDKVTPPQNIVQEAPPSSTREALIERINLQRGSRPQKQRTFKFNVDVPHPNFRIRKRFRGNKDVPKELIVEGKSGQWRANRRDDGTYYMNAGMHNPYESGKAMLELDKLFEPFPIIYDDNSLSLDSYKAVLSLKNRKHWSGEHIGFIPLNESAVHNKTLHNLGIDPTASKVGFDSEDKAGVALDEVNNMLQKYGVEHKAELFKHADGTFGINMPNFKLSRDYKKGGKYMNSLIKYKDGSKGVSLSFGRKEKDPKGGLTQKGVDKYNRATGGNLKMAVTTPPSKLKAGSKAANRRKSFCARMSGVKGPMAKNGKPTRKALALRKWNC